MKTGIFMASLHVHPEWRRNAKQLEEMEMLAEMAGGLTGDGGDR